LVVVTELVTVAAEASIILHKNQVDPVVEEVILNRLEE
jgi:hypothetical protein